jgi:MoaA/NifB/PqqE/SkfB family radical SAM enzyme
MKICGYILAFYIILLAAVPCCVIDNCRDDKTEQAAGHEKSDEDCGNCSPFFSCEGCGTATVAYEPFEFELAALKVLPVYAGYKQSSLPEAHLEFWQPPRLG